MKACEEPERPTKCRLWGVKVAVSFKDKPLQRGFPQVCWSHRAKLQRRIQDIKDDKNVGHTPRKAAGCEQSRCGRETKESGVGRETFKPVTVCICCWTESDGCCVALWALASL